ncbi:MAG: hypothetical protein ACRDD2_11515 [Sarcina sp.]
MSGKELKVKSFRVDEETFSKFKDIASSEFGNQGQCLDALINLYETEQSKSSLITRQLEIESFQDYINKINRLFVTSLQMSEDAEERAKEGFFKKIEAKEEALMILKEKIKVKEEENNQLKEKVKFLIKEQNEFQENLKRLEENKSTLTQLANRNYDLSEELKKKIVSLEEENNNIKKNNLSIIKLESDLIIEKNKVEESNKKNKELEKTFNSTEEKIIKKDEQLKKINEEKLSYQMLLERLKTEQRKEIEILEGKYESKYKKDLEERIELMKREHNLEIKELKFKIKTLEK